MSPAFAELIGTMLLVILGDGVVANVVLKQTKGNSAGWIVITAGWAFAVTFAVYCTSAISGAHLNPAVTVALAAIGKFSWGAVPDYVAAQMAGGFLGGVIVWLAYLPHWSVTESKADKLGVFCTGPAIRNATANLVTEIIGTFMLVLGVLAIVSPANLVPGSDFAKGFSPVLVGVIVWAIGLSLGGPTGYAINPARDLGPRIAHFVLPIAGKGGSDWGYAWVPVVGPVIGGIIGALFYKGFWPSV
ncbi:MAG: aquaporin family protein [Verrucomicrobiaceae bacterium]|nr:aquaporin family protein [Verrucomicrobiaceae bacterium]